MREPLQLLCGERVNEGGREYGGRKDLNRVGSRRHDGPMPRGGPTYANPALNLRSTQAPMLTDAIELSVLGPTFAERVRLLYG